MFNPLVISQVLFLVHLVYSQSNVTVKTSRGVVIGRGFHPNPSSGVSYDAFLGIPYGQIPARFQPPEPRQPWSDPLLAHSDGPPCPQAKGFFDEDCLCLNVFTPADAALSPGRLPVMVFLHGSAFTDGSSSSSNYGPDFLVARDVILVTINYRLGAAGYLTLGIPETPGNLGIYDALQAFKWVQEEISGFGGDPNQVTAVGHSAGSAIVQFLYISPLSKGLFKHAITESGSALSEDHILSAEEAVRRAKVLADAVGCDSTRSASKILSCLQAASINSIVREQNITLSPEVMASGVTIRFRPVLDMSFGKQPFFTDTLENMMKKAANTAVPLLTGLCPDEGIVIFSFRDYGWTLIEDNVGGFIPQRLRGSLSSSDKVEIINKIRSKYFPDTPYRSKILDIVKIYSDTIFIYPNVEFTRQFAHVAYAYVFTHSGSWTTTPDYFSEFRVTGVNHGSELPYLFYHGQDLGTCDSNLPNLRMKELVVDLWTNFAKTGSPDSTGAWKTVSEGKYQVIDSSLSTLNCSEVEDRYYTFWATLGPTVPSAGVVLRVNIFITFLVLCSLIYLTHNFCLPAFHRISNDYLRGYLNI